MVVMPMAFVCTAATAGATLDSTRFLPERVTEVRSIDDDIAEPDGLASGA
jgi:hypothetical protein